MNGDTFYVQRVEGQEERSRQTQILKRGLFVFRRLAEESTLLSTPACMRGDVKSTLAEINQHFRLHGMSFCSKKFEIYKGNLNPKEINMKS